MARNKSVYIVEYVASGEWVRVYNQEYVAQAYVNRSNRDGKLMTMRVREVLLLTAADEIRETGTSVPRGLAGI